MPVTIVFDEKDSVARVVQDFRAACAKLGVDDVTQAAGEDSIHSFHVDLRHSAGVGSGARLEKTIEGRNGAMRIIGITHSQRSSCRCFMEWLFG